MGLSFWGSSVFVSTLSHRYIDIKKIAQAMLVLFWLMLSQKLQCVNVQSK